MAMIIVELQKLSSTSMLHVNTDLRVTDNFLFRPFEYALGFQ